MTAAMRSALLFTLAGLAFLALGSVATAAIVRFGKGRIAILHPRSRHAVFVLLAALPWLASAVLVFSVSMPSLAALVVPGLDHCTLHDDGHAHLCFTHLPKESTNVLVVLAVVFAFAYAALRGAVSFASTARARRILTALARTGEQRGDLTVLASSYPVCFVAGLRSPRIFISQGLLDTLTDDERAVVLAHERAHVQRRDALVGALVRAFAFAQLPRVGRWLVREVELAAEQACDEEAAAHAGDRLAVAAAILRVERAARHAMPAELRGFAVAFGERAVAQRVEALLAEPRAAPASRVFVLASLVVAIGLLAASGELHHATESLLSIVAH